ncbi:mechanosensitive ion channel protein MscS [Candidatus Woesearchaeota archaeon]|nr:mechanosensitive ion channel protein MscS [Candidatus Woesearchaeota archaeon]|tara:strand:+ start:46311 stop:47150 length:840 start_codon:yes stop_codon:yes gene_type:complete
MALLDDLVANFTEKFSAYLPKIISVVIILVIGYIVIKILTKLIEKFFDKVDFDRSAETFLENMVKVVLWLVLLTVVLANLGVNVSGLIAGLGIMGFIVGFALKDTLGNLASGVFILFHKPFKVGDWIKVGGIVGGVERVGIAACELKSPDGTKITIPNSKIWGDVIQNFHGNPTRKLYNLEIGISYDSDMDKAIKIINDILKKDKRVLKDPEPQIAVKSLGDNSVNITVRPSMKKEDYWGVYFDSIKKIKEEFDKNNISIPFPQRDVWIKEMSKGKKKK